MLFLLIFPILVAGFFACHIHPVHSYRLHRYEGQYLYLKSAELSLKCFAIALALALSAHFWIPGSAPLFGFSINLALAPVLATTMEALGGEGAEARKMAWFFLLSALTFASSLIVKAWGHFSLRRRFGTTMKWMPTSTFP